MLMIFLTIRTIQYLENKNTSMDNIIFEKKKENKHTLIVRTSSAVAFATSLADCTKCR